MRISTLGYVGKQGIKNIGRNKIFSLASIATMSACIFLFGLFFSILMNFQYMIMKAEEGVAITVFFEEGTTEEQMAEIGEQLASREEVSDVKFVSADEAWERYKEDYFKEHPELAEGFRENPLVGDDNYEVYMKTLEGNRINMFEKSRSLSTNQNELVQFARSLDGVRTVKKSDVVASMLSSVNELVGYVSIAIIAILFGVSIFLINNTVATGITVRREEIAIMKYIGAKNFVVRSPFIIEGVVIGIIGAVVPLALLYVFYGKAINYILVKFSVLENIIEFLPVAEVYRYLLPAGLLLGVGIGLAGSVFTVRKHLKV